MELTQESLKDVITYNPETGLFVWSKVRRRCNIGRPAGCIANTGYQMIRVFDKLYLAHRLAWFYMTGAWPKAQIDHINGIRADNRFCNLREVTNAENAQNHRKPRINNKSGFMGVCKENSKYKAEIKIHGKLIRIGLFDTPEEAHRAYIEKKREIHPKSTI